MTKDERAHNFQKSFYGRRKGDPKPVKFPEPKAWYERRGFWLGVLVCVGLAVVLMTGGSGLVIEKPICLFNCGDKTEVSR